MSTSPKRYWFFLRASPALKRRIAIAAAHEGTSIGVYVRRVLRAWLKETACPGWTAPPALPDVEVYPSTRILASAADHRDMRIRCAELDVSLTDMVARVMEHRTPFEVEILAEVMTGN